MKKYYKPFGRFYEIKIEDCILNASALTKPISQSEVLVEWELGIDDEPDPFFWE